MASPRRHGRRSSAPPPATSWRRNARRWVTPPAARAQFLNYVPRTEGPRGFSVGPFLGSFLRGASVPFSGDQWTSASAAYRPQAYRSDAYRPPADRLRSLVRSARSDAYIYRSVERTESPSAVAERLAALEAARGSSAPASSKLVYHQPALAGWRLREAAERGALRIVPAELAYVYARESPANTARMLSVGSGWATGWGYDAFGHIVPIVRELEWNGELEWKALSGSVAVEGAGNFKRIVILTPRAPQAMPRRCGPSWRAARSSTLPRGAPALLSHGRWSHLHAPRFAL